MEWFYARNNQQFGPVSFEALVAMLGRGELGADDLVWREGMAVWLAASAAPELAPHFLGGAASIGYFNPVVEARAFAPAYAGFWLRFVAWFIDFIVLVIAGTAVNIFMIRWRPFGFHYFRGPGFYLFPISPQNAMEWIVGWLYFAVMESSELQATAGKLALGLVVTDMHGRRISFARASGRYWGKFISELTLAIGYMMAGWTQRKQALHDILASCLVVQRQSRG